MLVSNRVLKFLTFLRSLKYSIFLSVCDRQVPDVGAASERARGPRGLPARRGARRRRTHAAAPAHHRDRRTRRAGHTRHTRRARKQPLKKQSRHKRCMNNNFNSTNKSN